MKAVRDAEISLKDLQLRCYKEQGIRCEVAPVSGHNFHGLIERKIRSVQESFDKIGLSSKRGHATGLQTIAKLIENTLNNLPLGFSYGRSDENTPLLRLITPNMLRLGRLNSRAIDGPVKFPTGPKDLMQNVEKIYDAYYKVWNATMVPRLIPQPKWFRDGVELKAEDVVYFQKTESELSSSWTVGQVDSVVKSRDGVVRRAVVRYYNHSENVPRFTERAVCLLVGLFNVEDNYFVEDMARVENMVSELQSKAKLEEKVTPIKLVKNDEGGYRISKSQVSVPKLCNCCCASHCNQNFHNSHGSLAGVCLSIKIETAVKMESFEFPHVYEHDLMDTAMEEEEPIYSSLRVEKQDEIWDILSALHTKFDI